VLLYWTSAICQTLFLALDTQQRTKDTFTDSMEFTFSFGEKDKKQKQKQEKQIQISIRSGGISLLKKNQGRKKIGSDSGGWEGPH